ncbi:hypothetical protein EV426DRAFT_572707 [Tirmania nivea]|nr:hypothetical protein EV426DRAFT_572707 [Tirmania nivea]
MTGAPGLWTNELRETAKPRPANRHCGAPQTISGGQPCLRQQEFQFGRRGDRVSLTRLGYRLYEGVVPTRVGYRGAVHPVSPKARIYKLCKNPSAYHRAAARCLLCFCTVDSREKGGLAWEAIGCSAVLSSNLVALCIQTQVNHELGVMPHPHRAAQEQTAVLSRPVSASGMLQGCCRVIFRARIRTVRGHLGPAAAGPPTVRTQPTPLEPYACQPQQPVKLPPACQMQPD